MAERSRSLSETARQQLASGQAELSQAVAAGREAQLAAWEVGRRATETEGLLLLLRDIAEETQLLALNAAIEAAGAGAFGKRFAVVANSVGKLATRAGDGVVQASEITQRVQGQARELLGAVERAGASIERSQEAHTTVAAVVEQVGIAAQQVAGAGETIAAATAQQERATSLIAGAVEGVSGVSSEAASMSSQLRGIAERLGQSLARLAQGASGRAERG